MGYVGREEGINASAVALIYSDKWVAIYLRLINKLNCKTFYFFLLLFISKISGCLIFNSMKKK
jgi:hypothetical protein